MIFGLPDLHRIVVCDEHLMLRREVKPPNRTTLPAIEKGVVKNVFVKHCSSCELISSQVNSG